jgi:uncharacterized protein YcaQ
VGRIEPRIDRAGDTLRILDVWWEEGFDPLAEPGFVPALARAIEAQRAFGGVRRVTLPRVLRHRALVAQLRELSGASRVPAAVPPAAELRAS